MSASSWSFSILRTGAMVLGVGALTGCEDGPLKSLANELFPPVRPAQHQLAAARGTRTQLDRLSSTLLYASVGTADLQAGLPSAIKLRAQELKIAGEATKVRLELRDEEAVVLLTFDVTFDEKEARVAGEAEVHCAIGIERGALVLRPSASSLRVDRASYKGKRTIELLKPIVNAALRRFLDNLNGAIQVQRVPLDLHVVERLDLAAALQGTGAVSDVNAGPIELNVGLGAAAVLVDPKGIHVLADAVVLTPQVFGDAVKELSDALAAGTTPPFSSPQLAVLGECGLPLKVPEEVGRRFEAVCATFGRQAVWSSPRPAGAAPAAPKDGAVMVAAGEAEAQLPGALQELSAAFRAKVDLVEPAGGLPWDRTVVAISRAQLARGLNDVLSQVTVQASLHPPDVRAEIPPENRTIRTTTTSLNCDQVGGACPSVFDYPPYNPRGCDSNCDFWDLGCHGRKLDCERLKESERLGYEANKAAAQAAWSVAKAACEAAKAGRIAGCRANQAWLDATAGMDVGELRGGLDLRGIELRLGLDRVSVGPDLDSLKLSVTSGGGARIDGNVTVVPHNAGTLVCVAQWNATLTASVTLPQSRQDLTLTRTSSRSEADRLVLGFQLPEVPLQLRIEPPPVQAFLAQNAGKFALACPVPAAVIGGLLGFPPTGIGIALALKDDIVRDTFDVKIPARELPVVIPSQIVDVEGRRVKVVPSWGQRALVLKAE